MRHLEIPDLHAVSDDIGRERDDRDQNALIRDVKAQSAGENAVGRGARRALHDIRLRALKPEGKRREAVGNQVDKQQMDGVEEREAEERRRKDAEHLAHVRAEQELDGLAYVVVDAAALTYGGDDRREVVVGEHHVRDVFRHVRAGDAHADADVGGLDGRRVVHAVARHGRDGAAAAPRVHNAHLVLRLDAGIDAVLPDGLRQLLVAHAVERAAGRGLRGAVDNPQLASDGDGGVLMVAGDHHGADARAAALADGVLHLGADGVDHPGKADEAELLLETFGLHILRQAAGPETLRRREHAQRLIRHGVVLREDLGALFLRHGP